VARIAKAFLGASDEIDKKFGTMIPTITVGLRDLDNAMTLFIGKQDTSLGASRMLANGLELLAKNIEPIAAGLIVLAEVMLVKFATQGIGGAVSKMGMFVQQMSLGAKAAVLETLALKDSAAAALVAAAARLRLAEASALAARSPGILGNTVQASAVASRELLASRIALSGATATAASANAAYSASLIVAKNATLGMTIGT